MEGEGLGLIVTFSFFLERSFKLIWQTVDLCLHLVANIELPLYYFSLTFYIDLFFHICEMFDNCRESGNHPIGSSFCPCVLSPCLNKTTVGTEKKNRRKKSSEKTEKEKTIEIIW